MLDIFRILISFMLVTLLVSCAAPVSSTAIPTALPDSKIDRYPKPDDYRGLNVYTKLPAYDPNSTDPWQMDLRSSDLTKLDLSKSKENLIHATFDSKTQWPASDKMPVDFDWQTIMEIGKDPGLGVRELHEQGITGKGVNIAIIDQPLIIEHVEYGDQIRLYEEINIRPETPSQMHGPAVASIAVGKTIGVAPDANLYYLATWVFDTTNPSSERLDYSYYAQAVRRIIEINKELPDDRKIRAISMSIGLVATETGYDELKAAIEEAKTAGIFAMTVDLSQTHGWSLMGLGRASEADPNTFESYEPADWWKQRFLQQGLPTDTLLIPMDSRTTASPTGKEDYVFYRLGGMSWTVPYLAGMYALAVQIRPDITPEEFWETALDTGRTIQIQRDGKNYELGAILDPQALIEKIKGN